MSADPDPITATYYARWAERDRRADITTVVRLREGQRYIPRLSRPYWHEVINGHMKAQGIVEPGPEVEIKGTGPELRELAAVLIEVAGQVEQLQADYDAEHQIQELAEEGSS